MTNNLDESDLNGLLSESYSDDTLMAGIHQVKILFAEEALPRLFKIIQTTTRTLEVRKAAAVAIREIGAEPLAVELAALEKSADTTLKDLAHESLKWLKK